MHFLPRFGTHFKHDVENLQMVICRRWLEVERITTESIQDCRNTVNHGDSKAITFYCNFLPVTYYGSHRLFLKKSCLKRKLCSPQWFCCTFLRFPTKRKKCLRTRTPVQLAASLHCTFWAHRVCSVLCTAFQRMPSRQVDDEQPFTNIQTTMVIYGAKEIPAVRNFLQRPLSTPCPERDPPGDRKLTFHCGSQVQVQLRREGVCLRSYHIRLFPSFSRCHAPSQTSIVGFKMRVSCWYWGRMFCIYRMPTLDLTFPSHANVGAAGRDFALNPKLAGLGKTLEWNSKLLNRDDTHARCEREIVRRRCCFTNSQRWVRSASRSRWSSRPLRLSWRPSLRASAPCWVLNLSLSLRSLNPRRTEPMGRLSSLCRSGTRRRRLCSARVVLHSGMWVEGNFGGAGRISGFCWCWCWMWVLGVFCGATDIGTWWWISWRFCRIARRMWRCRLKTTRLILWMS